MPTAPPPDCRAGVDAGDQVIMHSFLPAFVQRLRARGEKDAWRLASTTINLLILLMAVIAVRRHLFPPRMCWHCSCRGGRHPEAPG